jgi:hypothetical protein
VFPVIDYRKSNLLKTREDLVAGHRAPLGLRFRTLLLFELRAVHHEAERVVLVVFAVHGREHGDHARRVIIGARLVRVARIVEIADLA